MLSWKEKLYKYPGFFVQVRTLRKYARPIAAHLLGYVSEVDTNEINNDDYYKMGDYIGKSGLEKSYETELRGKKGVNIYWLMYTIVLRARSKTDGTIQQPL